MHGVFTRLLAKNKREIVLGLFILVSLAVFIPLFTLFAYSSELTSKENIMNRNNTGVVLLDKNEKPFFTFYNASYKDLIVLSKISSYVRQAIIASEDKDFYRHPGFSVKSILRSFVWNLQKKDTAYGGSTVTQQLVKNALLSAERSFLRKYQEVVLSVEIERKYTKDQILEMYLNSAYFGHGAFGIEAAAKTYFAKHASKLTLGEAAQLAAILPRPTALNPIDGDKIASEKSRDMVLDKMQQQRYISPEEAVAAQNQTLTFSQSPDTINRIAPHFALFIRDELIEKYGEERIARSGFTVYTTLDRETQLYSEQVVKNHVATLVGNGATNGSAIVLDAKIGAIRAFVGSKDWYDDKFGKVNMVTAPRQSGSSFKPIVYAYALEQKIVTSATVVKDEPRTFPDNYKPKNYDGKFRGNVTLRRALANSLNVPSVDIMQRVGVQNGLDMAQRLGITTLKDPSQYGLSLVLGAGEISLLELTGAFATFANKGVYEKPYGIEKIVTKQSKTIFTKKEAGHRVVDEGVAFLISSILSDNRARQEIFGNALTIPGIPAAIKTGTTNDYKDALTIGFVPEYAVGVWIGNNDNKPMDNVAGSLGAAPIFRQIMQRLAKPASAYFFPPSDVEKANICFANGFLVSASSSASTEFFLSGTKPKTCVLQVTPSVSPGVLSPTPSPIAEPTTQQVTPTPQQTASELSPAPQTEVKIEIQEKSEEKKKKDDD